MARLTAIVSTAAIAGAAAFAALPAQAGGVAWGVSIGVPGFAISAGEPWRGHGYRPHVRPWVSAHVPAPVYVAPPVVYRPYYRPFLRPVPAYRYAPPVAYRHW
jgi:hypothetical protein